MNDRDFWISLSTQIARIDERTQQIHDELQGLPDMRDRVTAVEQRAKSNTHRLDGLKTTAALIGTLASVLINIIAVAVKAKVGG